MKPSNYHRVRLRKFVLALSISFVAIALIGWITGLQQTTHTVFLVITGIAFFPFIIAVSVFALLVVFTIVSTIVGGGMDGAVDLSSFGLAEGSLIGIKKIFYLYYKKLFGLKHPFFLGAITGSVISMAFLWVIVVLVIIPREAMTVDVLLNIKSEYSRLVNKNDKLNICDPNNDLISDVFSSSLLGKSKQNMVATDGFGRRIKCKFIVDKKSNQYEIRSLGFDGKKSNDDLCVYVKIHDRFWRIKKIVTKISKYAIKDKAYTVLQARCINS